MKMSIDAFRSAIVEAHKAYKEELFPKIPGTVDPPEGHVGALVLAYKALPDGDRNLIVRTMISDLTRITIAEEREGGAAAYVADVKFIGLLWRILEINPRLEDM